MRKLYTASLILAAMSTAALAQSADPQQPTCREALPQIQKLQSQAKELGIDTREATAQINAARQAEAAGNEPQCMQALIVAQNDIMKRAEAKGLTK